MAIRDSEKKTDWERHLMLLDGDKSYIQRAEKSLNVSMEIVAKHILKVHGLLNNVNAGDRAMMENCGYGS